MHVMCYHIDGSLALEGKTGTDQFPLGVYITENSSITCPSYDHIIFYRLD